MSEKKTDVWVQNHGSIITFMPITQEAENWIAEYVQEPLYFGRALCCEHRLAQDLAIGMEESGLSLS